MVSRIPASLALFFFLGNSALFAGELPASTVTVSWTNTIESPGVCVDRAGWFVSVIPDTVSIEKLGTARLKFSDKTLEAKLLFVDAPQRLCLLEASSEIAGVSPFSLAVVRPLKAGQKLECLFNRSAALTMVAGKDWSYRGERYSMPFLRVRVANPDEFCNSGTPLISSEGELAGILTGQELDNNGETHAIPVSRIRKLVEDVKRYKKSGPVWIGLIFHNETSTPEVIEVKSGSPAEEAGMKVGDVILSMNGSETASLEDLAEVIYDLPAGEATEVTVLRGLSGETVSITPRFADMASTAP